MAEFKHSLKDIYKEGNELVRKIQADGIAEYEKNYYISELLILSEELVKNNCKNFVDKYTIEEITVDELYNIAITNALNDALKWFSFEKGTNFMYIWYLFMVKRFNSELKSLCTEKHKWARKSVYSSDVVLDGDTATITDIVGTRGFEDEVVGRMALGELITKFEKKDKHGAVIRCLAIESQEHRRVAITRALGVSEYTETIRKQVQRVKERFIKFLVQHNYDISTIKSR